MKKSSNYLLAFLLSILLHALVLFLLLGIDFRFVKPPQESQIKLDLKKLDIEPKEEPSQKISEEKPVIKEAPPPKMEEKPPSVEPKLEPKMELPSPPKPVPTPEPKISDVSKKVKPTPKKEQPKELKREEKESLAKENNATKQRLEVVKREVDFVAPSMDEIGDAFENSELGKLYGDEFKNLTKEQKEFLKENLKDIGAITQRYLKYPEIAGRMGQEGVNVVEFLLHPNGDIDDLKLVNSSGFGMLDKNSIHTIEIAYKDYPRPKMTTKVRIFVHYNLY